MIVKHIDIKGNTGEKRKSEDEEVFKMKKKALSAREYPFLQ